MRLTALVLALATLLALAVAVPSASAGGVADPEPCGQYGVFVQLGLDNQYTCHGACHNEGVAATVGLTGSYDCGSCTNDGVFVFTGTSGCGGRLVRACVGPWCFGPNAALTCGAATEPACWALVMASTMNCMARTVVQGEPACM